MTAARPPKPPRRRVRKRRSRQAESRRRFLRAGLTTLALLATWPLARLPVVRRLRVHLRPPGALEGEEHFLAACIKCGQCVQVCPVEAIHLADIDEGLAHGAPYIDARAQACDFSCDALSCILACPTGALAHAVSSKEEVHIGRARLARPDACWARRGKGVHGLARGPEFRGRLRYEEVDRWTPLPVASHPYDLELCDLCVRECPIGETAIAFEPWLGEGDQVGKTPVVKDGCVGCGVCEMICPEEPACLVIDPSAAREASA